MSNNMQYIWDKDIKILSNKFIMKQLYLAFGIPCVFLLLLVSILNLSDGIVDNFYEYFESIKPILYISLGFLTIPIPIIFIFFRNKYPFTFLLDDKHAIMATRKQQRRKNNMVSNLLILLGILSGKPGAVGMGLINKSNNDVLVNFSDVKKVLVYKKQKTIKLVGGFPERLYLFCEMDNFEYVLEFVRGRVKRKTIFIEKN